ncbi:MAG TPA: tRNA pseudouridine(38-40) synthase TruA [Patescibacteria group bacterium]|nr:tRNA pseudouridine(38-40) synthase TruA [Patescibacteria group bacterium]
MDDAGAQPVPASAAAPLSEPRTYRLVLAYDGTAFHGWQVQPDARTVQGSLLAAAARLFSGGVRVVGASRTDAGVHALRQTAALTVTSALAPDTVQAALNAHLPREIRVVAAADAASAFDARRAAFGKRYAYLIDNAPVASPLLLRYAWHVPGGLDLPAMRMALRSLRGTYDFSAFCAAPGRQAAPQCRVRAIHVLGRHGKVALLISADRFLHHMVRNIVGSAVEVGRGAREPGWLAEVLASRDRTRAGPTAPAHGLTLVRVRYC